jgi:hypothetical protein
MIAIIGSRRLTVADWQPPLATPDSLAIIQSAEEARGLKVSDQALEASVGCRQAGAAQLFISSHCCGGSEQAASRGNLAVR